MPVEFKLRIHDFLLCKNEDLVKENISATKKKNLVSSRPDDLARPLLRVNVWWLEGTEGRNSSMLLDTRSIPLALYTPNRFHLGTTQIAEGGMKVGASLFSRGSIFLHLKSALA